MTDSSLSDGGTATEAPEATAGTTTEISGATSSSAPPTDDKGAKAPASVFEAVNTALKEKPANGESPAPDSPGTDKAGVEDNSPLPDEVTQDELNRYHSRTRKRIQQLLDKQKGHATELGQMKPLAEQATRLNTFVQQSGLDWEELNSGFELMRLMKVNPIEAREKLLPIMEALNRACGFELPPELKQKVDLGYVDEATARELAQTQARAKLTESVHQRTAERIEQAHREAAHQRTTESVKSAVSTFESTWKGSDPDFAAKYPRVMKEVKLALLEMQSQGKRLSSPAEAVKVLEDAKKAVETELKPFLPKREAIAPLPNGQVAANGNPKPKSMADAVMQGLRA